MGIANTLLNPAGYSSGNAQNNLFGSIFGGPGSVGSNFTEPMDTYKNTYPPLGNGQNGISAFPAPDLSKVLSNPGLYAGTSFDLSKYVNPGTNVTGFGLGPQFQGQGPAEVAPWDQTFKAATVPQGVKWNPNIGQFVPQDDSAMTYVPGAGFVPNSQVEAAIAAQGPGYLYADQVRNSMKTGVSLDRLYNVQKAAGDTNPWALPPGYGSLTPEQIMAGVTNGNYAPIDPTTGLPISGGVSTGAGGGNDGPGGTSAGGSSATGTGAGTGSTGSASDALGGMSSFLDYLKTMAGPGTDWMKDLMSGGADSQALKDIVAGKGNPYDVQPAWQKMVDAQQHQIQKGAADLGEQFNLMGGRYSKSFGNAAADYQTQAIKDQNSLLGQLGLSAYESSQGRNLSAAQQLAAQDQSMRQAALGYRANAGSQLGQMGFQGISQLSQQDFQDYMNKSNQAWQAAMLGSNQAAGAAGQLAQSGNTAATGMYNNSIQGLLAGLGIQTGAINKQFDAQQTNFQNYLSSSFQKQGLDVQTANALAGQLLGQGQLGMQMGQQQYGTLQTQIDRMYQEWMRTQPQYNPLLPLISQIGTQQGQYYWPQQMPSQIGAILGGAGSLAAALPAIIRMIYGSNPSQPGGGYPPTSYPGGSTYPGPTGGPRTTWPGTSIPVPGGGGGSPNVTSSINYQYGLDMLPYLYNMFPYYWPQLGGGGSGGGTDVSSSIYYGSLTDKLGDQAFWDWWMSGGG